MAVLRNSDGSSEWKVEIDDRPPIRLVSSVNGPLEVKYRDEIPTQASFELVIRPATGLPTFREVWLQDRIIQCFDSIVLKDVMPRCLVQVVVQILEGRDLWRELTGCVNAATMGLVSAGIPLKGLVSSVIVWTGNSEATLKPVQSSEAQHVVAFKFSNGPEDLEQLLVLCESTGNFTREALFKALDLAKTHAMTVYWEMRDLIDKETEEKFIWKES